MTKLSTESYKGVRDFYPDDQAIQNYIFDTWRSVLARYGYEEYNASLLEPAELYSAKTNEEHVNEQTYTFTDRGDRQVTLRPEMTPTVARMIAGKRRELTFPVRWFSIPNVFRYERPQRGRLREHWQLNVDVFGVPGVTAEVETITIASRVMEAFGATKNDFVVKINHRAMYHTLFTDCFAITEEERRAAAALIDRKAKMSEGEFEEALVKILGAGADMLLNIFKATSIDELRTHMPHCVGDTKWVDDLEQVIAGLSAVGITNVAFDPTLMRGFDYYTGIVFELFDTNPENNRALFGGGRYDRLLELFSDEGVPAVGFGMGDVTMRDFLEVRGLLPTRKSPADIMLCVIDENDRLKAHVIAESLRAQGARVMLSMKDKKLGDQIKTAEKMNVPYITVVGADELTTGTYSVKELTTGTETSLSQDGIAAHITKR
ncbi:MAG: histidine--tRNA ligase [Candidatus Pacebacteria bacterium]|nr:histidine--tRNA ligase [Candidatus Paceibacterota bacterium]